MQIDKRKRLREIDLIGKIGHKSFGEMTISEESFADMTSRIGDRARIGEKVYIGPYAVVNGEVGTGTNVQDFGIVNGVVGDNTSIAHYARVDGKVGNNTFIGFYSDVRGVVGDNCAIGIKAEIAPNIEIPDNRYVPHHARVNSQQEADSLELVEGSPLDGLNKGVLEVNQDFAASWLRVPKPKEHGNATIFQNPKVSWSDIPVVNPKIGVELRSEEGVIILGRTAVSDYVAFGRGVVIRADEGGPFFIGPNSILGDKTLLHGLETEHHGHLVEKNLVNGHDGKYSIYIAGHLLTGRDVLIHGPAFIDDDVSLKDRVCVFKAKLPAGCIVGENSTILREVRNNEFPNNRIPPNTLVV